MSWQACTAGCEGHERVFAAAEMVLLVSHLSSFFFFFFYLLILLSPRGKIQPPVNWLRSAVPRELLLQQKLGRVGQGSYSRNSVLEEALQRRALGNQEVFLRAEREVGRESSRRVCLCRAPPQTCCVAGRSDAPDPSDPNKLDVLTFGVVQHPFFITLLTECGM